MVAFVVVAEDEYSVEVDDHTVSAVVVRSAVVAADPIVGAVVHKIAVVKVIGGFGDLEVYMLVEREAILD